jgi:hypothetical protein
MNSESLPLERQGSSDGSNRSALPSVPVLDSNHPLGWQIERSDSPDEIAGVVSNLSDESQLEVPSDTSSIEELASRRGNEANLILSNVRQLYEIFPDEDKQTLLTTLQDCKNSLDEAVVRVLDKQSHACVRTDTLKRSQSLVTPTIREPPVDIKTRPASTRYSTSTSIRPIISKKKLPPDFLCTPVIRTVVTSPPTMDSNQCLSFTVNYNRKDCGLDVNVKQQKQKIVVNGLYTNKYGFPGLSFRAGIEVGDILYGINDEFFDSKITLKHVTTVLSCAGQYVKLHFIRFAESKSVPIFIEGGAKDPSVQLRKIHPCALLLLDQEVLEVDQMEPFCEHLSRIKERALTWGTGRIVHRSRIRDIADATQGGIGLGSVSSSRDDITRTRLSAGGSNGSGSRDSISISRGRRASISAIPSAQSLPPALTEQVADIRQNWFRDVSMDTVDLRPALFVCITGTTVVEAHQEYIIRVEDVSTGMEWYVRRRYKEFFKLREV